MTPTTRPFFEQPWPDGEYRFFQLGFVVDDLLGAAARWARVFSIGPFHVLPAFETPCTYRGADTEMHVQIAVSQAGPVQIELIHQLDDRPSVYREFLDRQGPGFHQLCTVTADYDGTKAYYEQLGYPLVCETPTTTPRTSYFDTFDDFGFYTEVAEGHPSFLSSLEGISRTCREWDGTDPVRLLTRDGYRTP